MIKLMAAITMVYFIPKYLPLPNGPHIFLFLSTWSLIFIAWLNTQKGGIATAFIAIESLSIAINLIGAICYITAFKSAYIYEHRPAIISACFIAELMIIGGRAAYVVGVDAYLYYLRNSDNHAVAFNRLNIFIRSENS